MAGGLGAGATPSVVRDWGLHREWRVQIDPAHPERPAHLVEVPWSMTAPEDLQRLPATVRSLPQPPAVRAGMRVMVVRQGAVAAIRLYGTALGTARRGETVAVRAGLGSSVVHGVVRGPGVVELVTEKVR